MDINPSQSQPVPTPPTPAPIPSQTPSKPHSLKWVVVFGLIVLLALVFIAGAYSVRLWPFASSPELSPTPSGSAEAESPTPLPAGVKAFSSDALGLSFEYLAAQGDPVIEEGDTVYVGGRQGQSVQVFTKEPADSLKTAIQKKFLMGISESDCPVNVTQSGTIFTGEIDVGFEMTGLDDPRWDASPCPAKYRVTNGIQYFWMDSEHPDRFFFFAIGQYAIMAEPGTGEGLKMWQDTFRVKSVAAADATSNASDWMTYANTTGGYSYQYPPTWNAVTSSYNPALSLFGRGATDTMGVGGIEMVDYAGSVEEYVNGIDAVWAPEQTKMVAGVPAIRVTFDSIIGTSTGYYLKQPGTIVGIYLNSEDAAQIELFEKLVSTFRFTK